MSMDSFPEEILFIFTNTEHAVRAVVQAGSVESH